MSDIMPPKIPDRWIPYKACGDVIEGTRIICFKVPLHRSVQTDPAITEIWDIPAVVAAIPNLGAVIDLTNTGRYYNPSEFEAAGVMHRKILMPGREIPSEDKVRAFMDTVDEFLGKDGDSLVGVHCTHGLNRTGYMVCRYLIDRLQLPAEEAIKRFEQARGYEIEREIYLASLLGKKLPRPDFEADSNHSQRSDYNKRRQRKDGKAKKRKNKNQSRDKFDSQSGSTNDSQTSNIDINSKPLTKNQRKHLRTKQKKQESRTASGSAMESSAKSQKRRSDSQENRKKHKKRKIYNYQ